MTNDMPTTEKQTSNVRCLPACATSEALRSNTAVLAYIQEPGKKQKLRLACLNYLAGYGTCEQHAIRLGMSKQAFHYHVR